MSFYRRLSMDGTIPNICCSLKYPGNFQPLPSLPPSIFSLFLCHSPFFPVPVFFLEEAKFRYRRRRISPTLTLSSGVHTRGKRDVPTYLPTRGVLPLHGNHPTLITLWRGGGEILHKVTLCRLHEETGSRELNLRHKEQSWFQI